MRPFLPLLLSLTLCSSVSAADKKDAKADSAVPAVAAATITNCSTDVFYSWKRLPPVPPQAPTDAGGKSAPAPAAPTDEIKPEEVFYQQVREQSDAKDTAEQMLLSRLPDVETRAREHCSNEHENQGSCLALRLRSLGEDFTKMDFESRKMVREQIMLDCSRGSGTCLSTRHSDPTCKEETPKPVAAEAPADAKKEKKK